MGVVMNRLNIILSGWLWAGLVLAQTSKPEQEAAPPSPQDVPQAAGDQEQRASLNISLAIKAKGTGLILPRVEVKVGAETLFTNSEGKIAFILPADVKSIVLYRKGFEKETLKRDILSESGEYDVFLFPLLGDDETITVRGNRKQEVSRKTISATEAKAVSPGGDPVQVIKLLPGVQSSQFDSRVIIRGSGPEDSRYFVDEINLPFIFHPIGARSVVPEELIEDVEFSSGGFGPRYGWATGGIITVKTKSTPPTRSKWTLNVNIPIYSGVYYETPLGEDNSGALSVSVRRSYLEYILPTVLKSQRDDDQGDLTLTPIFSDAHLRYLKTYADGGYYKLTALFAQDGFRLLADAPRSERDDGKVNVFVDARYLTLGVEREYKRDNGYSFNVAPSLTRAIQEFEIFDFFFKISVLTLDTPMSMTKKLGGKNKFSLGLDYEISRVGLSLLLPVPARDDPFYDPLDAPKIAFNENNLKSSLSAIWGSIDYYVGDFFITPGVRVFHDYQIDRSAVDPRLSLFYKANPSQTLKLAYGLYSLNPLPDEASDSFGNPNIDFEKAVHHIVGLETNWSDLWQSDVQLFYKRFFNIIRSDPVTTVDNDGIGYAYGFEVFMRRMLTERFFGWLSYTWSKNKEKADASSPWLNSPYDQTHAMTLVGNYRFSTRWQLGGRMAYTSGNPYTPVSDAVYNTNLDVYQPLFKESTQNSARLPSKTKLSFFFKRDFLYDTMTMALRFGVEELIIGDKTQNIDYNYDYSEQQSSQAIPAIPYIEVSAQL